MPSEYPSKSRYTVDDLLEIMQILRSPEGCPWDREQTHESIRSDFLEETHEAIEAINQKDTDGLCEELGDVLLQVAFHSQIEREAGRFEFGDVVDGVCKKLLIRHPHVFGAQTVNSTAQVVENWDRIKRETKGGKTQADLLRAVPRTLPALMRSAKVQNRAARAGFDWPEIFGALEALDAEVAELKDALAQGSAGAVEEELGDVLFSAVNVSRFARCDAEQALTVSCDKFIRRFAAAEAEAARQGQELGRVSPERLDELWRFAKKAGENEALT